MKVFGRFHYYGRDSRKVFNSDNKLNFPVYSNNWLIPVGLRFNAAATRLNVSEGCNNALSLAPSLFNRTSNKSFSFVYNDTWCHLRNVELEKNLSLENKGVC